MKKDQPNPPLGSEAQELAACRKAWKPFKAEKKWIGQLAWCIHHKEHIEPCYHSPFERISVIIDDKSALERPARLRSFRPVKPHARINKAQKAIRAYVSADQHGIPTGAQSQDFADALRNIGKLPLTAIHNRQYPDNAWDGTNSKVLHTPSW